jgi:succinoglycan biosynthesis protein ExoL
MAKTMRISYFGHDSSDAAIRKRVRTFEKCGYEVHGFMNRRLDGPVPEWRNVELGETENGAYLNRIWSVFRGAFRAAKHKQILIDSDLIVARNLDMLATAFLTKRLTGLATPVVYECLDVHRLLCREDLFGWIARKFEGAFVKRSRGVIVSSPAFIENHFERRYSGHYRAFLVENRVSAAFSRSVARPTGGPAPTSATPLRLGWVGILRCQRTLDLMVQAAKSFGDEIEIRVHGRPDLWSVPTFHETIEPYDNISFQGAYEAPIDLPEIYGNLDLIWSGDFMEAGLNSKWLLPNRIYEGGYFGVPAIAPSDTQTGAWVRENRAGFGVAEPIEKTLIEMLSDLIARRDKIEQSRELVLNLPDTVFVEPDGFMADVLDQMINVKTPTPSAPIAIGQPDQA